MLRLVWANRPWLAWSLLVLLPRCRAAASSTIPAPIVVSPSQYWEGNDGPWSSFTLRVGTPAQDVRVLISTAASATWVVLPEGCPAGGPPKCDNLRGSLFNINASSTWSFNNYYELLLESNLGYSGSGEFGFDKVGIGWQGSGGPILDHQVVAGIATDDFWFGSFGLTPRPTNFTNFNDPQPSFMETLYNKSLIPSLSWAYTAGAPYRASKVLGSLVLGGYDVSKAGPTNISVGFGPDISRDLTVGLQAITASIQGKDVALLSKGIFTFIDSTVPQIWLPMEACTEFEKAFGLTWDPTAELYLVNETLHSSLLAKNASFTFKIGNSTQGAPSVDIVLPYASFDLIVDYPRVEKQTRYFPLGRAANDTQYTLGRTFLQEAYLTVDYERSKFYLSQCQFGAGASPQIMPIQSINSNYTDSPSSSPSPSHSLSAGAVVGIAIACVAIAVGLIAGLFFLLRRRRAKKQDPVAAETEAIPEPKDEEGYIKAELDATGTTSPRHEMAGTAVEYFQPDKPELADDSPLSPPPATLTSASTLTPPPLEPIYEMTGDSAILPELPASAEPASVEPASTEPTSAEPSSVEPASAEPTTTETTSPEPRESTNNSGPPDPSAEHKDA